MRRSLAILLGLTGATACTLLSSYGTNEPPQTRMEDAASAVDGAVGPPPEADAEADADAAHAVQCPKSSGECTIGETVCCARRFDGGGEQRTYACGENEACATPGIRVVCQGPRDCAALGKPGTVCCFVRSSDFGMLAFACLPPEECKPYSAIVCDTRYDECPAGELCLPELQYHHELTVCRPP